MDIYEFGSVTYCTNTPKGFVPSDEDADFVAEQVERIFRSKLAESPFAGDIVVTRVTFEIGCILTTIGLGATVAGIYRFIKEYPRFRPGLILLFKDLNGLRVRLQGRLEQGSTYLMRDDIDDPPAMVALAENAQKLIAKPAALTQQRRRGRPKSAKDQG